MTKWAKKVALIEHLDRRRVALDQILWQAPAIIVAAQAFLMPVLALKGIPIAARALILTAGIAASVTGIFGLWRGREQELFFKEEIRGLFGQGGIEVPGPPRHLIPMFLLWTGTLVAFIIADVFVFAFIV